MRKIGYIILLFFLMVVQKQLYAQDVHFSQLGISQMYLNSALTGYGENEFRISGIHRNQWRAVSKPYSTFNLGIEKREIFKLKTLHAGLNFMNDVAGSQQFTTNRIQLGLAFEHIMGADSLWIFSLGLLPEIIFQQVSISGFEDQYQNNQFAPNLPTSESITNFSGNGFNASTGFHVTKWFKNKNYIKLGLSLGNLLKPQIIENQTLIFSSKTNICVSYFHQLSKVVFVEPLVFYSKQLKASETFVGAEFQFMLEPKNKFKLLASTYLRVKDAPVFLIGLQNNEWRLAFSYDINTSAFVPATNNRGAYEFGFVYYFNKFRESRKSFRNCPIYL